MIRGSASPSQNGIAAIELNLPWFSENNRVIGATAMGVCPFLAVGSGMGKAAKNDQARAALAVLLLYAAPGFMTGCGSSSKKTSPPPPPTVSIAVNSGSGQSAAVGTAFSARLVATVTANGTAASGVTVTFTAPASGASAAFAGGSTDTETTDANGNATSTPLTANSTSGSYAVTATVSGATSPANFSLTNTAVVPTQSNYVFYVVGSEAMNNGPNPYGVAGVVTIDSNGNVVGGEQDYNDAFGITSPQPSGDAITGGTLTLDATTGQGTLTLITNNTHVGVAGTEMLAVQFVNAKHALVTQFDGTATSSGSLDMQTPPGALSGGYAFAISGVDSTNAALALGGVFTVNAGNITGGHFDVNEAGTPIPNTSMTGTVSTPDSFGRGTISSPPLGIALNY